MSFTNPQVSDFKALFLRDFPYGGMNGDINTQVLDQDILNGMAYATLTLNPELMPDQNTYTRCYLLLSAHNMVLSLRRSSQGITSTYEWAHNQKAAGPVNESFEIPERIKQNPELMMLTKTGYGGEFLEIVLPFLCGQTFSVRGRSKP